MRAWDNGGSKIGPHMVFIWFGEDDAFVRKPYERVGVGLDTSQWSCAQLTVTLSTKCKGGCTECSGECGVNMALII